MKSPSIELSRSNPWKRLKQGIGNISSWNTGIRSSPLSSPCLETKFGLYYWEFSLGFGDEYFTKSSERESNKASLQGYKSILNSKQVEESLVNSARWEPRHGRFNLRHPWKQYLKIGSLTRQCAYGVEALNGCLDSDVQMEPRVAIDGYIKNDELKTIRSLTLRRRE
ncbi:hypothetical protein F3Y22_tig00110260pilonHSYRG00092 [Hibiscus syriacus]|uniref:Uncharacterized protein n=1 Tax=Hibiscus syriacus TaxID=106335 RepID=A0A6A3B5Z8_HIBSY|nr:hypothetical protein F3Y22_tig00110260pilonHSYRG00092 [Hibiscus syriacus]